MSKLHENKITWLYAIQHFLPKFWVVIKCSCTRSAQCTVLDVDFIRFKILTNKTSPAPLSVLTVSLPIFYRGITNNKQGWFMLLSQKGHADYSKKDRSPWQQFQFHLCYYLMYCTSWLLILRNPSITDKAFSLAPSLFVWVWSPGK